MVFIQRIIGKALSLIGVNSADNLSMKGLFKLDSTNRNTYELAFYNQEMNASSAISLLIDELIRNKGGKEKILDSEGSLFEGISGIFGGFGTIYHPYYILKKIQALILNR